jgi:hypothetical protein
MVTVGKSLLFRPTGRKSPRRGNVVSSGMTGRKAAQELIQLIIANIYDTLDPARYGVE